MARRFQKLPHDDKYNQVQLMTMSAADFLDQWFETDVLKATMSASGIIGTFLGVRSPGTAYVLLHHYMGEIDGAFRSWGLVRAVPVRFRMRLPSAAREAGAEIRTESPVAKILVGNGQAKGVVLENGDEIRAKVVSSSVDPRLTFIKIVGPEHLPEEFVEDVSRYKFRGSSGKVNLALDALPDFTCLPGPALTCVAQYPISPSLEYMERAYDDAKYGRFSRQPYIDIVIPSLTDPSVAPPGKHVMSCFVQYAPYHLKEGTWDEKRDEFGDTVINTIAAYAPNSEGHHSAPAGADAAGHRKPIRTVGRKHLPGRTVAGTTVFLRPVPGWAQYRDARRNLYMCGSATHPGGGIMGAPGRNAARTNPRRSGETLMAMTERVIMIGGGHNGLVAAFYLAKAGYAPMVLERQETVGGFAVTEEIYPGFRCSTLLHSAGPLLPQIANDFSWRVMDCRRSSRTLKLSRCIRTDPRYAFTKTPIKLGRSWLRSPLATRRSIGSLFSA